MSEKLTQDVQDIVDGIFKQKEEKAMRKETEEALNKSAKKINELAASLEAKESELSELGNKVEELESTVAGLSDKISELETEKSDLGKEKAEFDSVKEELSKKVEAAEEELGNMKKDQLAKARFTELTEAGIAALDEKAIEDQISKIREMEDEVFEAYKAERVELRKSIVAELEASSDDDPDAAAKLKAEEDAAAAKLKEEEEAAAGSDEPIEPMRAVAAALNLETAPSEDMVSKYKELGKAMAKKYEQKSE
ncbi:hypothetical protein LCGC14_1117090 [marine sediment metagenome]|uniref:Uncharacterized protein n=1 Tax=marine sediment metagenome TaxID=412755 RepID=A0A0F9QAV3_9ZZZZ